MLRCMYAHSVPNKSYKLDSCFKNSPIECCLEGNYARITPLNMFFGIKREFSCFFIGHESVEIRSFASNECNVRPLARKKWKNFSDA